MLVRGLASPPIYTQHNHAYAYQGHSAPQMGIIHAKGKANGWLVVVFTLTVLHVTVIANGFQPHSHAECRKSGLAHSAWIRGQMARIKVSFSKIWPAQCLTCWYHVVHLTWLSWWSKSQAQSSPHVISHVLARRLVPRRRGQNSTIW